VSNRINDDMMLMSTARGREIERERGREGERERGREGEREFVKRDRSRVFTVNSREEVREGSDLISHSPVLRF